MEPCIFERVNNSKTTKPRVSFINNRKIVLGFFCALHNLMTKLCSALFKYENKLKIG